MYHYHQFNIWLKEEISMIGGYLDEWYWPTYHKYPWRRQKLEENFHLDSQLENAQPNRLDELPAK